MFKKMQAIVLGLLGITAFSKDESGNLTLTEEERGKIADVLGQQFVDKFAAAMKEEAVDPQPLIDAIASHNAAVNQEQVTQFQSRISALEAERTTLQNAVAALSSSPEEDPTPAVNSGLPRREGVASVMRVDMTRPHYAAVNHFMRTGSMVAAEAATIDVADLYAEFGTYLSQNNNNLEQMNALFNGFTSAQYFTSTLAITEWRAVQALITSVSQQFTNKWTPSGKSLFRPLKIRNRRHKINFPVIPSEVLESYMLHMYDERLAVDQMPITKYIWNQLVLPQLLQDIELRMIFKGKYVEVTNDQVSEGDDGRPPEDSMDGIETILVDGLDGSKNINYFDGNGFDYTTATDDQMLKFVSDYVSWLSPIFRSMNMAIGCSWEFWKRYRTAYKNKWGVGSGTQDTHFGSDRIDFSNNVLVPMDGMYGSPILFATPKINMRKLRHKNDVPRVINDVQKFNYEARLFGEYWLGAGFGYGEAVFAFVPEGYNPKSLITSVYGAHNAYQINGGFALKDGGSGSGSASGSPVESSGSGDGI